jgi:signal peptidase I
VSNSSWKRRLLAVVLSLLAGAGHASLGRWRRGAAWYGAVGLSVVLITVSPLALLAACIMYVAALVDLLLLRIDGELPRAGRVLVYTLCFFVALTTFSTATRRYLAEAFRIPAGSMLPTLHIGDHIFTSKAAYWFSESERGDVIVFRYPCGREKDFIKRVVAVGGDTVEVRCGVVYVNSEPVPQELVAEADECAFWDMEMWNGEVWHENRCSRYSERLDAHRYDVLYGPGRPAADRRRNRADAPMEYAHTAGERDFPDLRSGVPVMPACEPHQGALDPSALGHFVESQPVAAAGRASVCTPALAYQISPGHVFVLGDNRDDSSDSRHWGPVPVKDIKGKATFIWYSRDREGVAWDRIGRSID